MNVTSKKNDGVSTVIGKILLVAITVVLVVIIPAVMCGVSATQSEDAPSIKEVSAVGMRVYVDPVTGVNYIMIYPDAICLRYHADGSLYVSEVKT